MAAPVGVLLAAFDLNELRDDLSTVLDISTDGLPLRVHVEAGDALLVRAHSEVAAKVNQRFRSSSGRKCPRRAFGEIIAEEYSAQR
jgi:hypothetical protein